MKKISLSSKALKSLKDFLQALQDIKEEDIVPFNGLFRIDEGKDTLVIKKNATLKEVNQIINQQLAKFSDLIDQFAQGDNFTAVELLKKELKRRINEKKLQFLCPVKVKNDNIYIELPGKKWERISFSRAATAKTLYIFFLQQLERASKDKNVSPYLSQVEMEKYEKELSDIYRNLGGRSKNITRTLCSKSTDINDFANAISSIRKYFSGYFNVNLLKESEGKCYSIEIMGKDNYGNPRYGIALDTNDFDLGEYSIK